VVDRLLQSLALAGAKVVGWEEWIQRTAGNRWQADCLQMLAKAATARVAGIMLDQLAGAFFQELHNVAVALRQGQPIDALEQLRSLQEWGEVGRRLAEPWFVLIAGPANAGKSTLFNALVGYERALVDAVPGTTRDVVKKLIAVDGWPIVLGDSAGFHEACQAVDRAAMARTAAALRQADLVLWVVDLTGPWIGPGQLFATEFSAAERQEISRRLLVVHNKADRLAAEDRAVCLRGRPVGLVTAATTGEGIASLLVAISRKLVPVAPPPGRGVPFRENDFSLLMHLEGQIRSGDIKGAIKSLQHFCATQGCPMHRAANEGEQDPLQEE
jgi:tRNA modification GTPase